MGKRETDLGDFVTGLLTHSQLARDHVHAADRPNWRRRYAYRLVITDALALCWAIFGAAYLSFDPTDPLVGAPQFSAFNINYVMASVALVLVWTTALAAVGSRNYRVSGTGSEEFKAVLQSAVAMLLLICLTAFALKLDVSRQFVLLALPLGLVAVLVSRMLWRKWLSLHRRRGRPVPSWWPVNLNWEESLRLDLYYVENWSLTADLSIMARTVRAVMAKDGVV